MEKSLDSSTKTAEMLRLFDQIGFQASMFALDAALHRREGKMAFAADEIRSLMERAARNLEFQPADFGAEAQNIYGLLDELAQAGHETEDSVESRRRTGLSSL